MHIDGLNGVFDPTEARRVYLDPLDDDAANDETAITTRRRDTRLALVASQTATRFAKSGVALDPMAWMLTPLRMFEGASALEACGERAACLRAVVLHSLDSAYDADPAFLDALLADDEEDPDDVGGLPVISVPAVPASRQVGAERTALSGPGRPRLFTAVVSHEDDRGFVQAFSAMVAPSPETLRRALRERHGAEAAASAVLEEGFSHRSALVDALVSPALAHVLEQIAAAPDSPLAAGLDVRVEQRFQA